MTEKFLPVGIQDFEKMITGNFLYVDKTRYLYEMARPLQGFYFLARPRRFGKSLMVSTFYSLFKGKKDLFKNLHISRTDWEWKAHPVLKIDFNQMNSDTPEKLEASLFNYIFELSDEHDIIHSIRSLPDSFTRLITQLSAKHDESVVFLIDEYDKPIIEHLGKGKEHLEIAKKNRDKLKQFFGVLKGGGVSASLRFVFITGISKFSRVSIFSDLNNLEDISMNRNYAAILGYNEDEMNSFFDSCIEKTSKDLGIDRNRLVADIERWYNGYRFTSGTERVYNPFSILNFFKTGEFDTILQGLISIMKNGESMTGSAECWRIL